MRTWGIAAAMLVGLVGVACNGNEAGPAKVQEADAYTAIVRWAAAEVVEPPDTGRPVVYVLSSDGATISSGVQAEVARNTVDEVDVRFADQRDQAIDDSDDDGRVRDGGVLLVVAPPPPAAETVEIDVDVYRDAATSQELLVRVQATAEGPRVVLASDRG